MLYATSLGSSQYISTTLTNTQLNLRMLYCIPYIAALHPSHIPKSSFVYSAPMFRTTKNLFSVVSYFATKGNLYNRKQPDNANSHDFLTEIGVDLKARGPRQCREHKDRQRSKTVH